MESIVQFLLQYGYVGMFVASFFAGSVLPFCSEAIMAGLQVAGLRLFPLVCSATLGNTLGGVFNYVIGRLGNEEWVYRLLRVKPNRLEKSKQFVHRYGAWMGLLGWLPIIGSVITVALGLLRVNIWKSVLAMLIGKAIRYLAFGLMLQGI